MAKVYVSSTFYDLKEHRERVSHVLRRLGHEDVAMEYYVTEEGRPLDRALSDVASCDLFIGVLAWRYGPIPETDNPEGLSVTEMEYRHAVMLGKTCLMFLLNEDAPWPFSLIDKDMSLILSFRERVMAEHVVKMFKTADELSMLVIQAVSEWQRKLQDDGYVPSSERGRGERLNMQPLPDDLVRACLDDECVLYAGSGLSADLKLPTWSLFVSGLLSWATDRDYVRGEFADSLKEAIEYGDVDAVADSLVSAIGGEGEGEALNEYLRKTFLWSSVKLPARLALVRSIPFCAALTTNFDNLMERTFEEEAAGRVYTPKDTGQLLDALSARNFFILKLYGMLERPDTVLIAPAQYQAAFAGNVLFSQFMEVLFVSKTLLFVGASLEGIRAYLDGLKFQGLDTPRQHYALIDVS